MLIISKKFTAVSIVASPTPPRREQATTTFTIGEHDFLLNEEPFRILSGAIHYFRVHPDQWSDRMRRARSMCLNTIETYVAWNKHAPVRGRFDVSGRLDLVRFLQCVADEGMYAIVRPGPFMCAAWHNGVLPGWLTKECPLGLRRSDPLYIVAVAQYPGQVLPLTTL